MNNNSQDDDGKSANTIILLLPSAPTIWNAYYAVAPEGPLNVSVNLLFGLSLLSHPSVLAVTRGKVQSRNSQRRRGNPLAASTHAS